MAKKELSPIELIQTHKPKNFKYRFILKDDEFIKSLEKDGFDMDELDTIHNDTLVQLALYAEYEQYERTIIGKAKEPTIINENGVIVSKKMVTKADKKLQHFGIGYFDYQGLHYVVMRMYYEKFDIIEIFVLT
jgi:hypothetical protein